MPSLFSNSFRAVTARSMGIVSKRNLRTRWIGWKRLRFRPLRTFRHEQPGNARASRLQRKLQQMSNFGVVRRAIQSIDVLRELRQVVRKRSLTARVFVFLSGHPGIVTRTNRHKRGKCFSKRDQPTATGSLLISSRTTPFFASNSLHHPFTSRSLKIFDTTRRSRPLRLGLSSRTSERIASSL